MTQARMKVEFSMKGQFPNVRQAWGDILVLTATAARQEWVKAARQKLHTTAKLYTDAISDPVVKRSSAVITLRGWLPNALECGHPPWDMKPFLLKGRKAKRDKRGRPYTTVPFGLKAPGGGDRGPSPPVMPSSIYKRASQLQYGQSMNLPKKYEGYGIRTRLTPDIKKWDSYTWKTSPFQGITKIQRFSGDPMSRYVATGGKRAGMRSGYQTYRRVSKASDPNSWLHPGFRSIRALDQAVVNLEKIFPEIVSRIL